MDKTRPPATATWIGRYAKTVLEGGQTGRVLAVFSSVFYVETPTGVFAVGHRSVDLHPMLIAADVLERDWEALKPRHGDVVALPDRLIAGSFELDLTKARIWSPEPPEPIGIAAGLTALTQVRLTIPSDGYGQSIPVGPAAFPEIAALDQAIAQMLATNVVATEALISLLGRGPGLTPSGDDVLGGIMIALHAFEHVELVNRLWRDLRPFALAHTHPISLAMLDAAATGEGSAVLHKAMNAFLSGRNVAPNLAALSQIGHSSGWDAFAGIVLVARALTRRARTAA